MRLFAGIAAAALAASGAFTSTRYAYRLQLPAIWGQPAVEAGTWQRGEYPHTNDPGTDTWSDGRGRYFVVIVRRLNAHETSTSFAASVALLARRNPDNACRQVESKAATIGGVATRARRWRCTNGYQLVDAATVRGRRGYLTYLLNESGSRGDDLPMFLKLVHGFSFVR